MYADPDESQECDAEQNKPETEGHTLDDSIYIKVKTGESNASC